MDLPYLHDRRRISFEKAAAATDPSARAAHRELARRYEQRIQLLENPTEPAWQPAMQSAGRAARS